MISPEIRSKYKVTIGIECHVQLKTKTKLFSAVGNDAREAPPNTLVNHIDFGLPGALPVLNAEAIYLASKAAYALNSYPQTFSKFDRKHYFYPDLPMGYQITQYDEPIVIGGTVDIKIGNQVKQIGITRAHLEADAGKSVHPAGKDYSLVDLNRAGTPLLEIVSEPDMSSSSEAKAYARELYLAMRYSGVSEADLYYGNMRFDVNVSVSQNETLGTRTETKNLNSFRSVEKTVDYEVDRQIELIEKGQKVNQETRGWDDSKQKTFLQRTKESADDYRYMPDPDIPPVILEDSYIADIKKEMPILPPEWRKRLSSLGLEEVQIETLLEADIENDKIAYLLLLEENIDDPKLAKFMANWFVNLEIPARRDSTISLELDNNERHKIYKASYLLFQNDLLSSTNLKTLLSELLNSSEIISDIEAYATTKGYIQVSNVDEINKIVATVIEENPKAASDVKNGEMKAIGFLVGQVMKLSKGSANPALAQKLIKKQLSD